VSRPKRLVSQALIAKRLSWKKMGAGTPVPSCGRLHALSVEWGIILTRSIITVSDGLEISVDHGGEGTLLRKKRRELEFASSNEK
jgi:hypothetical protein